MKTFQPFTENNLHQIFSKAGDEFILLETARTTAEDHHSYLFTGASKQLRHVEGDDPVLFLEQCQKYLDKGCFLAGWFSYEFGYTLEETLAKQSPCARGTLLAELGVYPSCQIIDHSHHFDIPPAAPADPAPACQIANITLNQNQDQYLERIKTIQDYIRAGDTYQVNYTLKLLFDFLGSRDALYLKLRRNQQVSFSAYIKQKDKAILSFSPELFFRKEERTITVRPMKGTISRGCTREEDQENGHFLQTDLKSRAENVMIVDLLRNDLGRIAERGTVTPTSLFDIEVYNSLLQMTSTIEAKTKANLVQLFKALFPCGSVTGAPKIHTMEIIKELETEQRGVYTGAIGFLGPAGQCCFNVPIRTVVLDKNKGQMGIGSGIVADSDPQQEWQECLLKGHFLTKSQPPFELIETLLWQPGAGFKFTALHQARLLESAHYFNFIFSEATFHTVLNDLNRRLQETSRVRITLNREGQLASTISPCPEPAVFRAQPIISGQKAKVCLSQTHTISSDPFLRHKTSNRTLYNETWAKATAAGYLDALFLNERQELSEGCISNLFLVKNGLLLTPPTTAGLLPGVFRQYLLEAFPDQVKEQTLYKDDILDKGTIPCIGNSVRGLIPVEVDKNWLI